jgi:hypothetical protein
LDVSGDPGLVSTVERDGVLRGARWGSSATGEADTGSIDQPDPSDATQQTPPRQPGS